MMHRPPQGKEPSNVGQREQTQQNASQGERMSIADEMKSSSEFSGFGSDSASARDVAETETPASMSSQDAQGSEGHSKEGGPFLMGYHSFNSLEDVDIPQYVRDHNATLTFPEKLMLMLIHVEREHAKSGRKPQDATVGWVLEGKAFVIRDREYLVSHWLPIFFGQAKFTSFTRKLYRWGFRKVNMEMNQLPNESQYIYFGNEHFQRDDKSLLSKMKSVTSAKTRVELAAQNPMQPSALRSAEAHQGSGLQGLLQPPSAFAAQSLVNITAQAGFPGGMNVGAWGQPAAFLQQAILGNVQRQGTMAAPRQQPAATNPDIQQRLFPQDAAATQYLLTLSQLTSSALNSQRTQQDQTNAVMGTSQTMLPNINQHGTSSIHDERQRMQSVMELLLQQQSQNDNQSSQKPPT